MNRSKATQIGLAGEDIACIFLARKGFRIVERNFRKPWGEIDIIATKAGTVRFIEVKASKQKLENISRENIVSHPEEQLHSRKIDKVARTAQLYMQNKGDSREYQLDAVTVIMDMATRKAKCRLYEQIL